jgi:Uma2 family endonuclease
MSGDALKYELVDGEPRAMVPANRTHGILQSRLATLINNHLHREKRPCNLVVEPGVVPRLLPDHNVRVPDLAVTCTPYQTEEAVLADAVLVIEILSPSNQAKTWTNVWAYQHSERSGNPDSSRRSDCGRTAAAVAAGRVA